MTVQETFELARAHHSAGRLGQAQELCRQILTQDSGHAHALDLLGQIAYQLHDYAGAADYFGQVISLKPDEAERHNRLGMALAAQGQSHRAIAAYQKAVSLQPTLAHIWYNLAGAYRAANQTEQAFDAFRQALALNPHSPQAHNNFANLLMATGYVDQAVGHYDQALALKPDNPVVASNRLFALQFDPKQNAQMLLSELRSWDRKYAQPLMKSARPHDNDRSPQRRLKIGYVSPDLCAHVVGWHLQPLLSRHDHQQFEVFCYASVLHSDAVTQNLRAHADHWHDVLNLNDEQVADLIRQDRIDILVDLSLHSERNRLLVFARKPAPVQVSYLGYCGSTGMKAMDYLLSDPHIDPTDSDLSDYAEKTWRLPNTFWCYQAPDPCPPISPLPCAKSGQVTFGCLNNFAKVSTATLDLWIKIVQATDSSRLLLHCHPNGPIEAVRRRFISAGIDPNRIEFIGKQSFADYLRTYHRIDIALDPTPYGGGITTCDGLWMGVPAVALSGQTAVGRGGRSILCNIGLPNWVAHTQADYVRIATDLAADREQLQSLRFSMRERMRSSPLMDARRFARDVEAAFKGMWTRWCSGE